ncbi:polysaccharide biosynthesis tyrosine autokinase [Antrihabitans stalactiti]|uniref:Polysaccharide chain length determinant N-terminal domain-containing protein n=1 Tax=Antrihabitans stalactiti TaxID=2584121 RepID=A0A848KG82_9NOCA|nr:polysaccharide biosynthesis tyrosine autokinase [Antrihabitans stalactiti]NMN97785.1 hypothetical protein [Antrihabitans stalactiti]
MNSNKAFAALRDRWWIPVVAMVIGIGVGIGLTFVLTPQYTSSAKLFVSTTGGTTSTESFQGDQFSQQRAGSYADMLSSEILGKRVVDALRLPLSGSEVASKVTATAVPKTVLINVSVKDDSAQRSAAIANKLAEEFISYITPLETPAGQAQARVVVTLVSPAAVPDSPTFPKLIPFALYGAIIGLVIGLAFVAFRHLTDRSVGKVGKLAAASGLPVLGPVTVVDRSPDERRAQMNSWDTPEAEAYRKVRVALQSMDPEPRIIVVTSSKTGESTVHAALDLAIAFAETDRSTVLIETDSANPVLASELSLAPSPGLIDLISVNLTLDHVVQKTIQHCLSVVPVGTGRDVAPLLPSHVVSQALFSLLAEYNYIVIDTPPMDRSSAASVLAAVSDGTLLVVDPDVARRKDVVRATKELRTSGARPLGAVLVG